MREFHKVRTGGTPRHPSITEMLFVGKNPRGVRGGEYCYDASRIKDAHEWCQRETFKALAKREARCGEQHIYAALRDGAVFRDVQDLRH
jgi:hypothetical protein